MAFTNRIERRIEQAQTHAELDAVQRMYPGVFWVNTELLIKVRKRRYEIEFGAAKRSNHE
jgi:hypothetical protein